MRGDGAMMQSGVATGFACVVVFVCRCPGASNERRLLIAQGEAGPGGTNAALGFRSRGHRGGSRGGTWGWRCQETPLGHGWFGVMPEPARSGTNDQNTSCEPPGSSAIKSDHTHYSLEDAIPLGHLQSDLPVWGGVFYTEPVEQRLFGERNGPG